MSEKSQLTACDQLPAVSSTQTTRSRRVKNGPAGRPSASEVEARLAELVHVAGRLFLDMGYRNVSLELIAREAHVAVRTIYVKFGGKSGLLGAVLDDKRRQFFGTLNMLTDQRPLKEVLNEFSCHLYEMVTAPEAIQMQRMLVAEAANYPESAEAFFSNGPNRIRELVAAFLTRPDIRTQLRDDVPEAQLPDFLINCIISDQTPRLQLGPRKGTPEERASALAQRMDLFYRSVLR